MKTEGYYQLPSKRGEWWVYLDETPAQALVRIPAATGVRWIPEIRDELKSLFPDDSYVDQIPVIE